MLTTPDFGQYNKEIIKKPTGGLKFSKEEKFKTFLPETPDLRKHNTNKATLAEFAPKYSINKIEKETQIGKAIKRLKKIKYPDQGDYVIPEEKYDNTIFNRTITGHFAKEPKSKLSDNHTPGVWKYKTETTSDFGKSTKNKLQCLKQIEKILLMNQKLHRVIIIKEI